MAEGQWSRTPEQSEDRRRYGWSLRSRQEAGRPELPDGVAESNWRRTVPGKGWFVLFRLYSPTEPFFDGTWRPGDFEKIEQAAK